jgi:hypothetical protein
MKLDILIDDSIEIMHVFSSSSYVENSGCYGNKYTENMANFTQKTGSSDNAKSIGNIFMKLEIWVDGSLKIMHIFFFSSYVENSGCYENK